MDDPAAQATRSASLRRHAALLGWVTAGLVVLSLVLLAVAAWQLTTEDDRATISDTAVLPLSVEFRPPGLAVLLAAVALVAATFLALAALETATAMQVLNRDRRIPPPLPAHLQQARRWTLGPVAVRSLAMEHPPEWPALAVPSEDLPPGTRLRCTVLVPAHDEEAVIGATLRSLADQTRRPDRIIVIADNCADATGEVARACRGGGGGERRQHREEGRRAQPAARAAPALARRRGRRHGHGCRLDDLPGLPGDRTRPARGRRRPDGGRRALLRRGGRRTGRASSSATSTAATSGSSPAGSTGSSC